MASILITGGIMALVFIIFVVILIIIARREIERGVKSKKSIPIANLSQKQLRKRLRGLK